MAEVTPPLFQTIDAEYTGADLGLPYRDIVSEGVAGTTDLQVTQRGAGANMSVDVAAGVAWIKGDDSAAAQPTYRVYNDATKNLTVTAADATNPRIDLVIAEVRDAAFSGVSTDWRLRVVAGTPAGSPSAPATPSNSIVLARLSVPALDTTIGTAQITDYRPRAGLFSSLGPPAVTALPTQPYAGQVVDWWISGSAGTGEVLRMVYLNSEWRSIVGRPLDIVTFTASGTFTKATYPWLRMVNVRLVGGGGAGGGCATTAAAQCSVGAGGGGGGYAETLIAVASLSASETVTVGAAGAGGTGTGGTGGTTSFGAHAAATGGAGGGSIAAGSTDGATQQGGNGGVGYTGDIQIAGGAGGAASRISSTFPRGGSGGQSQLGGGAPATGNWIANGATGGNYGGGGGGGSNAASQGTTKTGGNGAAGIVIVELYA